MQTFQLFLKWSWIYLLIVTAESSSEILVSNARKIMRSTLLAWCINLEQWNSTSASFTRFSSCCVSHQLVYNPVASLLSNMGYCESIIHVLCCQQWLPVEYQDKVSLLLKALSGLVPIICRLPKALAAQLWSTTLLLRHNGLFYHKGKHLCRRQMFLGAGLKLWNELPQELMTVTNFTTSAPFNTHIGPCAQNKCKPPYENN